MHLFKEENKKTHPNLSGKHRNAENKSKPKHSHTKSTETKIGMQSKHVHKKKRRKTPQYLRRNMHHTI